jgi:hypothetical protein
MKNFIRNVSFTPAGIKRGAKLLLARKSKDVYFSEIADLVSSRSTCLRWDAYDKPRATSLVNGTSCVGGFMLSRMPSFKQHTTGFL